MSIDGGLTAIGGFLYQTVVALSLKAAAFQDYDDAPNRKGDLEMVLGFAKDGEVRYEDEDQDISIRNVLHGDQPGYILVQLKYSSLSPRPPVTKLELKKIISRLQASEAKARAKGQQVTGYSLLTNRPLNADAQKLADTYHLPIYVAPPLPERYWEERLRQFAGRFGCIDSEIDAGIRQGIGDLLLRATNPRYYGEPVISREILIKAFTRCPAAHEVTPAIVAAKGQEHLRTLFTHPFHLEKQPLLVRQSIHERLSALVERHAFVVLSGGGGNGKTAVLWQWVYDALLSVLPEQPGIYYCLSPAQSVQEGFLAHQFCSWANVPAGHHWQSQEPRQVLHRLEIACAASTRASSVGHPIFVLGLDAVDEAFRDGDRSALKNILLWFWNQEVQELQQPNATLIVTCRDAKELAEHWLDIVSPYAVESQPLREVEVSVDEFSASELVAVARLYLPALAARFVHTDHVLQAPSSSLFAPGQAIRSFAPSFVVEEEGTIPLPDGPSLQAVNAEVFEALRHPTLWHCLLEVDSTLLSPVLDGEADALAQLTTHFLIWFCAKVRARWKQMQLADMIEVLKVIACRCDPRQSARHRDRDWVTSASTTPYMTWEQAERFFQEALSAGLVVRDTGGWWRWRHPFIGEHLASQSLSLEDE